MAPYNHVTEQDIEAVTKALHEGELGCRFEPVVQGGIMVGSECTADHEKQARLLLQALVHAH